MSIKFNKQYNYYYDKYDNRAYINYFKSKTKAKDNLLSLINCKKCVNCINCINCNNCTKCTYSEDCMNCAYCMNCSKCSECTYTRNCSYCSKEKNLRNYNGFHQE